MAIKHIINQYYDLGKEMEELRPKIEHLENEIKKIENRIAEIEEGETVKDKVKGGFGGLQTFTIEGIPSKEYNNKKMELHVKKTLLESRKETLKALELEDLRQITIIEEFINGISDAHARCIVRLRVINKLSWREVAEQIGGGNTEDSVRMIFNRCLQEK